MATTVLKTKIEEVENKTPSVGDLVKKMHYDAKISEIETKYFTISDYDKFTSKILETKIKEKGLVDKSNISNLLKNSNLKRKRAVLAAKKN